MKVLVLAKNILFFCIGSACVAFLMSCERSRGIGFDLVPQNAVEVLFTDTLSIKASTVIGDSLVTAGASNLLLGQYTDPVFGKVKAQSYIRFTPFGTQITLDQDAKRKVKFDSLTLRFTYSYFYADKSKPQKFNLHKLTGELYDSVPYCNFNSIAYDPIPLTSVTVSGDELADDLTLRFRLDEIPNADELVSQIVALAKDSATTEEFEAAIKGFALVPDGADEAAILGFSSTVFFQMYYRKVFAKADNGDSLATTSSVYTFNIGGRFNQVESQRSGTQLSDLTVLGSKSSEQTDNLSYVQAGTNIYTKLEFPTLANLKLQGNAVINKAELIIKPLIASVDVFKQPDFAILYESNESNDIAQTSNKTPLIILPEEQLFGNNPSALVAYRTRDENYVVTLSSPIQRIFSGKTSNEAILISAANSASSVNRLILNNQKNSPYSMKLRVYYTIFK